MKVICPEYDKEFEFNSTHVVDGVNGMFEIFSNCAPGILVDKAIYRYLQKYCSLKKYSTKAKYFMRALHGEEDENT